MGCNPETGGMLSKFVCGIGGGKFVSGMGGGKLIGGIGGGIKGIGFCSVSVWSRDDFNF